MSSNRKGSKELTQNDRKACLAILLMHCHDDKLEHGIIVRVATTFGTSRQSVRCVWVMTLSNMEAHLEEHDNLKNYALLTQGSLPLSLFPEEVFCGIVTARGKREKYNSCNELATFTTNVPLNECGTYRNHAAQIRVGQMMSWRLTNTENSGFQRTTSTLKPRLTKANKQEQLLYCLNFADCFFIPVVAMSMSGSSAT